MTSLVIELPPLKEQTKFNLERWAEICADPQWQKFEGRIETDRHGYVLMSPPPEYGHGRYEFSIGFLLKTLMKGGAVATHCPISTADGVRAADDAWTSDQRLAKIECRLCLTAAPEICVEVLSPRNRKREMAEKKALYFAAGAEEVWFCDGKGRMTFFIGSTDPGSKASVLCPDFPAKVEKV